MTICRNRRTLGEGRTALTANGLDKVCLHLRVKPLGSYQDHRRTSIASDCQVWVEIMVQGNADSFVTPRPFENGPVFGPMHSDLVDMHRIEPLLSEDVSCVWSEPLVQQKPRHATRSNLSSSTVASA